MKKIFFLLCSVLAAGIFTRAAEVAFRSGSNGSYGPLVIPENSGTVVLPMSEDGIFHCTTISIGYAARLRFAKNAANTPVYLLATGDIEIQGEIDVSGGHGSGDFGGAGGIGGPGGFDGGVAGVSGAGPGGGAGAVVSTDAESGAYATDGRGGTERTYGNSLLFPLIGGSGGGGKVAEFRPWSTGGGGGGGAILIASDTRIIGGSRGPAVVAKGGSTGAGGGVGSGGAIRLVAPSIERGLGLLALGSDGLGRNGGQGRVRIDSPNQWDLQLGSDVPVRRGRDMVVFPANPPRLEVIEVADQSIPEGATGTVRITLDRDASPDQTIKVRASNFSGRVAVHVVVSPETGETRTFVQEMEAPFGAAAIAAIPIVIPADVLTRIQVWSR